MINILHEDNPPADIQFQNVGRNRKLMTWTYAGWE